MFDQTWIHSHVWPVVMKGIYELATTSIHFSLKLKPISYKWLFIVYTFLETAAIFLSCQ